MIDPGKADDPGPAWNSSPLCPREWCALGDITLLWLMRRRRFCQRDAMGADCRLRAHEFCFLCLEGSTSLLRPTNCGVCVVEG
eukprot:362408-Amorphochlora_amoeboformis.AAC.2